ncbi:olfactory receptor 10J4-like [Cynoglossus semilaevis]|uniref:Olfactory receptor n=1 Tax=Cynoglossus semilaevis TaxID=244447 RepID=A0A3P8X061_CYNSE|nr:olfactory receptor 10J4-like [Cynoglossus semilaevis]
MEDTSNVTYITFEGHVDVQKYRYVYFVVMLTCYVLIVCCNSTIVCLIVTRRNLHQPMYIFIAALLTNSVLCSTVIHPKLLIDFLSPQQITTFTNCVFQGGFYYIFSTSEFLLLSAMAYDRYASICKPLQYHSIMRRSTVVVLLLLAWLLPACELTVSIVLYFNVKICHFSLNGLFCNTAIYTLQCVSSTTMSVYGVVILLTICLLPFLFILFTYTRIFIISYRSTKKVRTKAVQTCLPHLLVLINLSCFITYDVIVVRMGANLPKLVSMILTFQITISHPLLNPFIYGLKMKEIAKPLKLLLFSLRSH